METIFNFESNSIWKPVTNHSFSQNQHCSNNIINLRKLFHSSWSRCLCAVGWWSEKGAREGAVERKGPGNLFDHHWSISPKYPLPCAAGWSRSSFKNHFQRTSWLHSWVLCTLLFRGEERWRPDWITYCPDSDTGHWIKVDEYQIAHSWVESMVIVTKKKHPRLHLLESTVSVTQGREWHIFNFPGKFSLVSIWNAIMGHGVPILNNESHHELTQNWQRRRAEQKKSRCERDRSQVAELCCVHSLVPCHACQREYSDNMTPAGGKEYWGSDLINNGRRNGCKDG